MVTPPNPPGGGSSGSGSGSSGSSGSGGNTGGGSGGTNGNETSNGPGNTNTPGYSNGGGGTNGNESGNGPGSCGTDPIVLDLNGDGVHLVERGTVRFDMHNQTGTTASTAWVSAQDGLLAMDINNNGTIDSSRELLSEFFNAAPTQLGQSPRPSFANGWAALQYLDSAALGGNNDGILNSHDQAFSRLRVWQDANSNGVTDAGELRTLAELGITSITTHATDSTVTINDGQSLLGTATFTMNGTSRQMTDVLFDTSANSARVTTIGNVVQVDTAAGSHGLFAQSAATLNLATLSGSGQRSAYGSSDNDTIIGSGGNDILVTGGGDDVVNGGAGDDTLYLDGAESPLNVDMSSGIDTLVVVGTQNATLNLGLSHAEIALGGVGNDLIVGGGTSPLYIDGGAGNDIVTGSSACDHLLGGDGSDQLFGLDGDDVLESGVGDNILDGGAGNNTLIGGDGHNILRAGDGNNTIYAGSGDSIVEVGDGNNVLSMTGGSNYVIAGNGSNTLTLGESDSYVSMGNGNNVVVAGNGDTTLDIEDGDNSVTLGDGANFVLLGNGTNAITVGNGDNTLVTGLGINTLNAGIGNNTFVVNNMADIVNVQAGGLNTIRTSVSFTAAANVRDLVGTSSADLTLSGNGLDNNIAGNTGNDLLDGGLGADNMIGGQGNDTYVVDSMGDAVTEALNSGSDTIRSSINYTLGANLENLILTGTATIGTGNELENTLTANDLGNTLLGNAGNDTLMGGVGNDLLDGGTGADSLAGGGGNDSYLVDNVGDVITEGLDAGTDFVQSSVSYTLSANVENLTLTGTATVATGNELNNVLTANALGNTLSGNAGSDTLIGGQGNDLLDGGTGADSMAGGAGNDTYIVDNVGDVVTESLNLGTDNVLASINYVLPDNVENLTLTGTASLSGTGNGLANVINGNSGANALYGLDGNDILYGFAGNDTLNGGKGDDLLNGGDGNDTYIYNKGDALDRIVEGNGTDSFVMGQGMNLNNIAVRVVKLDDGSYQAQLRLLDAGGCEIPIEGANFSVTKQPNGSWLSPIERFVFADGSVNTFNDVLIKTVNWQFRDEQQVIRTGRDDDIIHVGNRQNVVYSGTGNDIVYTGNSGDIAYGEGGNDYLFGGNSNDTLDGGYGIDILSGGNGQDTLRDAGGNGAMLGGMGDDVIYGSASNNFVAGGKHQDQLHLGTGNNVVAFNRQDGNDLIYTADSRGRNTLSLGGGIQYSDLQFQKSNQDLILRIQGGDSITFKDWYASTANHDFVTLQVIEAAAKDYRPGSSDILRNAQVEQFDFQALVDRFDQARASTPNLNQWSLTNALLTTHLSNSNTAALGGDLTFDYGMRGDLAGMNLSAAQDVLKDPSFGSTGQQVHSWSSTSIGSGVKLS